MVHEPDHPLRRDPHPSAPRSDRSRCDAGQGPGRRLQGGQIGANGLLEPDFPATAPAANPVFYRTYSRRTEGGRESWHQVSERNLEGLRQLGHLDAAEVELIRRMQKHQQALPSGRWLWIGGTPWIEQRHNFSGAYNCTSTNLIDWEAFGLMMDLAMMGCGTGAIIEPHLIERLPLVRNRLVIESVTPIGLTPAGARQEATSHTVEGQRVDDQGGRHPPRLGRQLPAAAGAQQ